MLERASSDGSGAEISALNYHALFYQGRLDNGTSARYEPPIILFVLFVARVINVPPLLAPQPSDSDI
jgi:hypothetical protein